MAMDKNHYSSKLVTLICTDMDYPEQDEKPDGFEEIVISTAEINTWDLPSILAHGVLKVETDPNRLIKESSYFRGLLRGSFSESRLDSITIRWNLEYFVSVLRAIFGCPVEISSSNFIPLNEVALFFGVDTLLLKCRFWLEEITAYQELQSPLLCLNDLIHIWNYGSECENDSTLHLCTSYLARNFMWASSFNSFTEVPDGLLCSCIKHPDLTVDSEKCLCNVILDWVTAKTAKPEGSINNVFHEIRTRLLPLWFAAGKQMCPVFCKLDMKASDTIYDLAKHPLTSLTEIFEQGDLSHLRIRLTKYTQKVDLSGCPQITPGLFLLSVLSIPAELTPRKIVEYSSVNPAKVGVDVGHILTFEAVQELDISNCPSLSLDSAIDCLCQSFPSLRTLRASYSLNFRMANLCHLVQKLPLVMSIDLTVDISPILPSKVSVTSSSSVSMMPKLAMPLDKNNYHLVSAPKHLLSNITSLTFEGRTDIHDSDLISISAVCISLNYVNMNGCISVTDRGISAMILRCKRLRSVLACDTSFGDFSIRVLCSDFYWETQGSQQCPQLARYKLLDFHVGGCYGINVAFLSDLMAGADYLRSLCLREIQLVDNALYHLKGTSLEMLDVSNTKVSGAALSHLVRRNPGLRCLKTRGCRNLEQVVVGCNTETSFTPRTQPEFYSELGESCKLDELELGWSFSFFSLGPLRPAIRTLRTLIVGLGGSLGYDGLKMLPTICPLLHTLILYFQVISDSLITELVKSLPHLQFLALCYCSGDISSLSFKFWRSNLKDLKLERVAPWMTNEDLVTLAENCPCLIKLSLTGCALLNPGSQDVISSGWPGLTSLHLEECGEITSDGVKSLLDCYALQDLKLRHTGSGISRNFIIYAASKLPMLRKISLDFCDAGDGDLDIPSFADRYFLSSVIIARCKLQNCSLDMQGVEVRRRPLHKEALVLVWNSEKLARTVVKERL